MFLLALNSAVASTNIYTVNIIKCQRVLEKRIVEKSHQVIAPVIIFPPLLVAMAIMYSVTDTGEARAHTMLLTKYR